MDVAILAHKINHLGEAIKSRQNRLEVLEAQDMYHTFHCVARLVFISAPARLLAGQAAVVVCVNGMHLQASESIEMLYCFSGMSPGAMVAAREASRAQNGKFESLSRVLLRAFTRAKIGYGFQPLAQMRHRAATTLQGRQDIQG